MVSAVDFNLLAAPAWEDINVSPKVVASGAGPHHKRVFAPLPSVFPDSAPETAGNMSRSYSRG